MRNLLLFAIFSVFFIFSACTSGGGGEENRTGCANLNLRVINGEQCNTSGSPVVSLAMKTSEGETIGTCSGTLVTLNDVLTAAHCIADLPVASIEVFTNGNVQDSRNFRVHPRYDGILGSPNDIAMISVPNPFAVSPVPLLLSDPVQTGEEVTAFGYGTNEQLIVDRFDLRAAQLKVTQVSAGLIVSEFDKTNTSVCTGDSGGPITQTIGGVTSIVGVTSIGVSQGGRFCEEGSSSAFINMQTAVNFNFVFDFASDAAAN